MVFNNEEQMLHMAQGSQQPTGISSQSAHHKMEAIYLY